MTEQNLDNKPIEMESASDSMKETSNPVLEIMQEENLEIETVADSSVDEQILESRVEGETSKQESNSTENDETEMISSAHSEEPDQLEQNENKAGNQEIIEFLSLLSNKLDSLSSQFSEKIRTTERDSKIILSMDAELKKYKDDFFLSLYKPILSDIIDFRDSMLKFVSKRKEKSENEQNIPLKTFESYAFDVLDIIERYGGSAFHADVGDPYTPIKQKAVKKIQTADNTLHGKIAESLSEGYLMNEKVIKPETVSIYVYEKPSINETIVENSVIPVCESPTETEKQQ